MFNNVYRLQGEIGTGKLAARIMRDNPKEKYFVVGHADSRGTIEHNAD